MSVFSSSSSVLPFFPFAILAAGLTGARGAGIAGLDIGLGAILIGGPAGPAGLLKIGGILGAVGGPKVSGVNSPFPLPPFLFLKNKINATTTATGQAQDKGDFGFSIPSGATIRGISVKVEAHQRLARWCRLGVEVSNDNGAAFSTQ